jgi:serine/threonine-protein kinase
MSRDEKNDGVSAQDRAPLETRETIDEDAAPLEEPLPEAADPDAATVLGQEDHRIPVARQPASDSPPPSASPGGSLEMRALEETEDKTPPPAVGSARAGPARPTAAAVESSGDERHLAAGTLLFGEYEIVNVLGVGGMGEVYRARHRRLDEFRAIKVMRAELSKKKGASEFFYREAKALLAVRHPAVVHCHDLLSSDEGEVFLIMEMIEGIPLSKKMQEGPLSPDDVAELGARVSRGLSAAHREGVVHRDVSPDNIVLPHGRVQEAKLIDFGIAKILEEGDGTIIDGFKGKLSYASPEQLGFFGGKLDGRSDFYSLGLVLAAAALGRPMDMGTTLVEAVDARRALQSLPDEIPIGLRSAIQPLLALDPEDRPKYVDRLFVAPGGVEDADSGFAQRSHSAPAEAAGLNRTGLLAAAGLAGVLALAGGAYWLIAASALGRSSDATRADSSSASGSPAVEFALPVAKSETVAEIVEPPVPEPVPKAPARPVPKRLSARERIKIIGLLNNAKLALGENRLMSPAGDNAYDRYRRVLSLDRNNATAKNGLRAVSDRYLKLASASVRGGELAQARDFLAKARKADSSHPDLAAVEARLN